MRISQREKVPLVGHEDLSVHCLCSSSLKGLFISLWEKGENLLNS